MASTVSNEDSFATETLSTDPSDAERCAGEYSLNSISTSVGSWKPSHATGSLATIPIIDEGIEPMNPEDSVEEHCLRRQLEAEIEYGRKIRREMTAANTLGDNGDDQDEDTEDPSLESEGEKEVSNCDRRTWFRAKNVVMLLVVLSFVVLIILKFQSATPHPAPSRASAITDLIRSVLEEDVTPNSSLSANALDRALAWIIDTDSMQLSPTDDRSRLLQRFVFTAFWGEQTDFFNLPDNLDECSLGYSMACNDEGELYSLTFRDIGYAASIPDTFRFLTHLRVVNITGNKLYGTIPTVVGELTNLELVSVAYNEFTGAIPTEIGKLSKLVRLHLNGNQLTGTIPTELRNLPLLEEVLYHNNPGLSGNMPFCDDDDDAQTSTLRNNVTLVADCDHVDCPCCSHCCNRNSSFEGSTLWAECED